MTPISTAELAGAGTLGEAVLRGQCAIEELQTAEGLRTAATCVARYMKRGNWSSVLAAGRLAAPLVAAALMLAGPPSRAVGVSLQGAEHVLVVEAVAVSGLAARTAVEAARAAAVGRVGLFVWRIESPFGRNPDFGDPDDVFVAAQRI